MVSHRPGQSYEPVHRDLCVFWWSAKYKESINIIIENHPSLTAITSTSIVAVTAHAGKASHFGSKAGGSSGNRILLRSGAAIMVRMFWCEVPSGDRSR